MSGHVAGARKIHTSPAVLTVDRVLHSFRARSKLILSQIEDADDVIVKSFSDDDDDDEEDDNDETRYAAFSAGENEDIDMTSTDEA